MRKILFGGIMLFLITSCTSPLLEITETEINIQLKAPPNDAIVPAVEASELEGSVGNEEVEELPIVLMGSVEDDTLSVSIKAEMETDKLNYKTNLKFRNKSDKSLDLLFDCGLLISIDNNFDNFGECPAVESMLMKKQSEETVTVILPKEYLTESDRLLSVRYRQNKIVRVLQIKLQIPENQ